jgi:hypothetical protein
MAGDSDFLLRIVAKDLDEYCRFQIEHLSSITGVRSIKFEILMEKIKRSHEIPVLEWFVRETKPRCTDINPNSARSGARPAILLLTPRAVTAPARRNAREPKKS